MAQRREELEGTSRSPPKFPHATFLEVSLRKMLLLGIERPLTSFEHHCSPPSIKRPLGTLLERTGHFQMFLQQSSLFLTKSI